MVVGVVACVGALISEPWPELEAQEAVFWGRAQDQYTWVSWSGHVALPPEDNAAHKDQPMTVCRTCACFGRSSTFGAPPVLARALVGRDARWSQGAGRTVDRQDRQAAGNFPFVLVETSHASTVWDDDRDPSAAA